MLRQVTIPNQASDKAWIQKAFWTLSLNCQCVSLLSTIYLALTLVYNLMEDNHKCKRE